MSEKLQRLYLSLRYQLKAPGFDGMMNAKKCEFLYQCVEKFPGERNYIVEIGSFKGCSTTWLASAGKRKGFKGLIAIDLFEGTPSWKLNQDTFPYFQERMETNQLVDYVTPIKNNSQLEVKDWDKSKIISILHIDGDHEYEAAKADIDSYLPYVQEEGFVIIDDYDSAHQDVQRAVHESIAAGLLTQVRLVKEDANGQYGTILCQKVKQP